jgi:hypothetical protein
MIFQLQKNNYLCGVILKLDNEGTGVPSFYTV